MILWYLDRLACMNCDEFSVSVIYIRRSSLFDNIISSCMHLLLSPTLSCYGWWVLSSVLHWAILLLPTEVPIISVDCWSASSVHTYMPSRPTYMFFTPEKSEDKQICRSFTTTSLFVCIMAFIWRMSHGCSNILTQSFCCQKLKCYYCQKEVASWHGLARQLHMFIKLNHPCSYAGSGNPHLCSQNTSIKTECCRALLTTARIEIC